MERANAGKESGRESGGRGIAGRRLWKVFVLGQKPLWRSMEGIGGGEGKRDGRSMSEGWIQLEMQSKTSFREDLSAKF